jgi:alcohol dehydrogenase class IV
MSLIVCSPSTQHFLKGEKFIVNGPPTVDILKQKGKYTNVIAIGGGAVIDTAKILSKTRITCYPTTASGASATSHSVYWDGNNKKNCERFIPDHIIFEPNFIKSLPKHILQYTKYDAISHCLDVMWSKDYNKLDTELVEHTLNQLIQPDIKPIDILKLGHVAGTFIQKVPTTILHALSYPITGKYGITHGKALGFLIFPLCKIFGYMDKIKQLSKLNDFLDIDINFIIIESKKYSKFYNTFREIDIEILKKELINEKNKLLN